MKVTVPDKMWPLIFRGFAYAIEMRVKSRTATRKEWEFLSQYKRMTRT